MLMTIPHARRDCAALLLVSGKRFLVLQHAPGTRHCGTWGLPGGLLESGEPPYAAALREPQTDLGQVPPHLLLGDAVVQRGTQRYQVFACRTARRRRAHLRLSLNDDYLAWRWVSLKWAARNARRLHPALQALVEDPSGRHWLLGVVATANGSAAPRDSRPTSDGVRAAS